MAKCNSRLITWTGWTQFSSVAQLCPALCDPMDCSTPGFPVLHHLPEFAQIHVHCVSDAIQPSHPLLSPLLPPSILPSIRVFSISPSNEYSGLISFRMDWFDLLAAQGTLKSPLQHHSSKAWEFFSTQPSLWSSSHGYWKNHIFDCTYFCQQSDASVF